MTPNSKALRALVEELREALKPFAKAVEPDDSTISGWRVGMPTSYEDNIRALKALTAAEAHLASSTDVEGWRSMESAPRDGTEFQAWIERYGWEPRCRFEPETEAFQIWGRVDYDQDGWDVYLHMVPACWQPQPSGPLPESPSPEKEGRT